jgi:hypothetical protein
VFSSKPIFHLQAEDTFELAGIGGHDRGAGCMGMGGDQQVVAADRLSRRFQLGADSAVSGVGWHFERQHIYLAEQVFDSFEQSLRTALRASVAQFGRHHDSGADVVLAKLHDPLCNFACGVSNQVGNDVRVQHVAGQNTRSGTIFQGAGTLADVRGGARSV